jgi:hypothetical protein
MTMIYLVFTLVSLFTRFGGHFLKLDKYLENNQIMKPEEKYLTKLLLLAAMGLFMTISTTRATPSTQIWIPSTDFQKFKTFHLGLDNYFRLKNQAYHSRGAGMFDAGLTMGILPFKKIQAEAGIDYLYMGDGIYDNNPVYFNIKAGTPENCLFKGSPAFALGVYNLGTKSKLTNYNVVYALIAKTIPVIGRVSAGYYSGNKNLLVDENSKKSNSGILLSVDRPMTEISDKLWLAIDYQGGKNYIGALNFGFSWSFSSNTSVIFAYDIYNNNKVLYNSKDKNLNSITIQLDINF